MNTTDLIKRVRRSAFLNDTAVDWTNANIIEELNDMLTQLYVRAVVTADQGHWQMSDYFQLVAGQRSYRLPDRAAAGGVQRFQLSQLGDIDWFPLDEVPESDALRYEYAATDSPLRCVVRGESVIMLPSASTASQYYVRTIYQMRPARLIPSPGLSFEGQISSVNTSTRVLTVTAGMSSYSPDGVPTAQNSGTIAIDIVRPEGWHAVQWTGNATITNSGLTYTLATHATNIAEANDISMIRVGDYVRVAKQSEYPPLPLEFHRSLADSVAVKILTIKGMSQKAQELAQAHVVPDLKRFSDLLQPRVGDGVFTFVAPEFV